MTDPRTTPPSTLSSPRDPRILDTLKRHPVHWHTLTACGGFAAVKCFDCGFTAEGGYLEVVEKWNAHLPS